MAGTQQYQYPPPPPPPGPPPSNHQPQHQQYGYAQQPAPYQQAPRGGGPPRGGRGGAQGGRGDFHGNAPYNPQNPSAGFNAHQGPTPGFNGPNGQQAPAPYIGPQAPGPQGQQGPGYSGPGQWNNDHNQHGPGPQQHAPQSHGPQQHATPHHGPPHGPPQQHGPGPQHHGPAHHNPAQQHQPPMQHGPQVAPLQAQNYHPNYAPQTFQPPQAYGQQPPQPFQPPQPSYNHGHAGPTPPHGPPAWNGPPQQTRPPFNNNRGGRGGFTGGRGGHEAPLMGPPIRMGFDNERGGGHMTQASNGFPQQYPSHTPPAPFTQPYQNYPPQDFSQGGQRPSLDPNPYNSGPIRGRGGNNNFRGRGRGDFQQFRGRGDGRHNHNNGHRATSENFHKPAGADANGKKKKKRRTNTLGLTPNGVDHEDSDDEVDDADEEARLVTLLGPDTPQLPTDLDAWLAERRSRYPTKARRDAAAEELRQRREQNRQKRHNDQHGNKVIKKEDGETKMEKQQRKAEKLRLELEKTERRIQEQMSGGGKRKREDGDEGDNDRGQVSDAGSDGSSGSESEADQPETVSSRHHVPFHVQQPPKAQLQRHCKYFSTGGTCGKKGKCRFVHDQEVRNQALRDKEANGGKMTLAQRLILNDTAKDDLTILKSIKYLKEKGLMSEQLTGLPRQDDYKDEENGYAENLNYGDN
ncbi:uncharacterized protein LY89DRAFT_739319 [Mollisia scopiformis]|uniref:C3H1-type domain-containing protein n=1 Tax=Mollisia scopiformis TaxID=149040 RepID=A0A194WTU3_MOLSC|nr:uncharacterized protein LY89DRAFT_739319 [Mollisia scopiformis]KUJ11109.1 hypothetical protein LY89DRAFT_739319 [Mollisia scopiformis]